MAHKLPHKKVDGPVFPRGLTPSVTTINNTDTTMPLASPPPPYEQRGSRGEINNKGPKEKSAIMATVAVYQQSPNLRDLARRMPVEVRLPGPTRHKITSERYTGHNRLHHNGFTVTDTEVRQTHLRVRLSDFGSTSLDDFQNGSALTMKRALLSYCGDGRNDPATDSCQDLWAAIVIAAVLVVGITFAARVSSTRFKLIAMVPSLLFAGLVAVSCCFRRIQVSNAGRRSLTTTFHNCRLVVLAEAGCDSGGRIPTSAEDFDYTLQSYSKSSTLYIVSSRELVTMRLIQLLKFADPRAAVYLDTPPGQALLEILLPAATEAIAVAV